MIRFKGTKIWLQLETVGTLDKNGIDCWQEYPDTMLSIILRLNTATLILAVDVITPPSLRKKGYIIRKEKNGWLLRDPGRDNSVKLTESGKIKTITRNWIHVAILRWRNTQAGNLVALKFHSEPVKKHQAPSNQDQ